VRIGDHKGDLNGLAAPPEETSILYNLACVYSLLGRTEEAIDCLARVMEHGTFYENWATKDSDLDSLRSDPRFQTLLSDDHLCRFPG
jgi:adenylate cyclase